MTDPGHRVIAEQRRIGGAAVPWRDMTRFIEELMILARRDLQHAMQTQGTVFFDRGLIDAAAAYAHCAAAPLARTLPDPLPCHHAVFIALPWPDIFETDPDRPLGFADAMAQHDRLVGISTKLGYRSPLLPKTPPDDCARFVPSHLG